MEVLIVAFLLFITLVGVVLVWAVAAVGVDWIRTYWMIRRSHPRGRRGLAHVPSLVARRVSARPGPGVAWKAARDRFHAVCAEYAAYECDPLRVLRLPALADVSVPSTARFIEAFAAAQALDTNDCPPDEQATAFTQAAERAERAWLAARDAAERIQLQNLSPTERATVERVIKLLMRARRSDNDAERLAGYSLARSELARLERTCAVRLPQPARAALDAAAPGELTA